MSPSSTRRARCSPPWAPGQPAARTSRHRDYESRVRDAVQTMLDRVVGPGNATVAVAADMSQESASRVEETYSTPDGAPALSESTDKQTYEWHRRKRHRRDRSARTGQHRGPRRQRHDHRCHQPSRQVKNNAVNKVTETRTIPAGCDHPPDGLRRPQRKAATGTRKSPRSPHWSPPRPASTRPAATRSPSRSCRSAPGGGGNRSRRRSAPQPKPQTPTGCTEHHHAPASSLAGAVLPLVLMLLFLMRRRNRRRTEEDRRPALGDARRTDRADAAARRRAAHPSWRPGRPRRRRSKTDRMRPFTERRRTAEGPRSRPSPSATRRRPRNTCAA